VTPAGTEAGQVLNLTPETLSGQGEGLTSGGQAGSAGDLTSVDQAGKLNNLSYLWLLALLVVGGGGVFFLMRRTGKLPELVKHEDERKLRREQRMREWRSAEVRQPSP
jgi:hypothetical protein